MTPTLPERIRKLGLFDRVVARQEAFMNGGQFPDGAEWQHARTEAVVKALIECAQAARVLIPEGVGVMMEGSFQWNLDQKLTALEDAVKRMEEGKK